MSLEPQTSPGAPVFFLFFWGGKGCKGQTLKVKHRMKNIYKHKGCEVSELVSRKLCAEVEKHFSFASVIKHLVCEQKLRSLRIKTTVSAVNADAISFLLH